MSICNTVFCHSHWECYSYCFNLGASTINYMQTGLSLLCTTEESVHAHLERSSNRRIPIICPDCIPQKYVLVARIVHNVTRRIFSMSGWPSIKSGDDGVARHSSLVMKHIAVILH